MARFGRFDDAAREYVILRPDTPLPWINYLGCEDYFGIISNTAGGYSFYRDARLRRLTRYRYNNAPFDVGGRYLYLRDRSSGELWSPSWQPVRAELEDYRCRHGLGYTAIGGRCAGIDAETLYFVPLGETLEIWRTRLTNQRTESADLSLFSAVEFCLWDAWDDATNLQRNYSTGEVEVVDGVIYHKTEYRERRNHFAYFACSAQLAGFDTQRDTFLVELGEISTYPPSNKENAGVFCHTKPWIMVAETLTGNGDRALDYYLRINPSAREPISDLHRCEPYVYAQVIAGKDAPTHGEAKNSWLTGTAAWNLVAVTQWILGIRPDHDGLRIDPCLPADWDGFTAIRRFRGARYHISVTKTRGTRGRVSRLLADGRHIDGNLVPTAPAGATVTVEAAIHATA
jgi:cellobiose phosphorylase